MVGACVVGCVPNIVQMAIYIEAAIGSHTHRLIKNRWFHRSHQILNWLRLNCLELWDNSFPLKVTLHGIEDVRLNCICHLLFFDSLLLVNLILYVVLNRTSLYNIRLLFRLVLFLKWLGLVMGLKTTLSVSVWSLDWFIRDWSCKFVKILC